MHWHLLTQKHWASFNTNVGTNHPYSRELGLFKWRTTPFSKGKIQRNSENVFTTFKNLLLQNHRPNSTACLGEGDSCLFQQRPTFFPTGRWFKRHSALRAFGSNLFNKSSFQYMSVQTTNFQICFDEIVCKILRNRGNGPKVVWKKVRYNFLLHIYSYDKGVKIIFLMA